MPDLEITSSIDTASPALEQALTSCRSPDLMRNLGEAVAAIATRSFREESLRPSPWPARSAKTRGSHPLLRLSTALWRSIGVTSYTADQVSIGTDRPYAPYHQFGTRKMPARPFMPFDSNGNPTPAAIQAIQQRAESYLSKLPNIQGAAQ